MSRKLDAAAPPLRGGQLGFSLIEIVIAMFVLALTAMAVLPLLIGNAKASVENRSTVAATAFAEATLEKIRAEFPTDAESSCATVRTKAATGIDDPAGTGLKAGVTVGSCPAAVPGTVKVTVKVTEPAGTSPLVALATEILVATA
ncbi:MAG: type II secretion system protein [Propionicimonas sp.]|nr:type II secretion system protein [Propionicimonas sp.]